MSEIDDIQAEIAAHEAVLRPLLARRRELIRALYVPDGNGKLPRQQDLAAKINVSLGIVRAAVLEDSKRYREAAARKRKDEISRVAALRKQGLTQRVIAERLEIPESRVHAHLIEARDLIP